MIYIYEERTNYKAKAFKMMDYIDDNVSTEYNMRILNADSFRGISILIPTGIEINEFYNYDDIESSIDVLFEYSYKTDEYSVDVRFTDIGKSLTLAKGDLEIVTEVLDYFLSNPIDALQEAGVISRV